MLRPSAAPFPSVVILVPYRPANDRQRWCWDMVRPELERFGWPIIEGTCGGRWARAEAVNDAARKAGSWDAALIADCDTLPDHEAIVRAMWWVSTTGGGARPHGKRYMLTDAGSLVAMQRGVEAVKFAASANYNRFAKSEHLHPQQWYGGGLDVVTREAFDAVGGFCEAYQGWGWEDSQFHLDLIVHRRWDRLPGEAWHLNHPTHDNRPDVASRRLFQAACAKNKAKLDRWLFNQGLPLAVV